tara:strand:- start:174 stop:635 length:462 start_codon:yes stop_codon:yes gene_type:complete
MTCRIIQAVALTALCCQQISASALEEVTAEVDSLSAVRDSLKADLKLIKAQVDSLEALQTKLQAEEDSKALPEVFVVSDVVGKSIDIAERQRYGLFPSTAGFVSATYYKRSDGSFFVRLVTRGPNGKMHRTTNDVVAAGISYVRSRIDGASSS